MEKQKDDDSEKRCSVAYHTWLLSIVFEPDQNPCFERSGVLEVLAQGSTELKRLTTAEQHATATRLAFSLQCMPRCTMHVAGWTQQQC